MTCTSDSRSGALERFILQTLARRELHGYGMVQFIRRSFDREFLVEEGAVYPALQRLEVKGWIEGAWGVTSNHRRARIYWITTAGRKRLEALTATKSHSPVEHPTLAELRDVTRCLLFGCLVTGSAFGQSPGRGIPVNVCMVASQDLRVATNRAKPVVSAIFSEIGVNLIWHTEPSECGFSVRNAFRIDWAEHAPTRSNEGILAGARPFGWSETSITIYEVPLQRFLSRFANAPEVVLAYVLAHELAHVMQGLNRHSATGILKAKWSYLEYHRMLTRKLAFTERDVDLIRAGLEGKRASDLARGAPSP